MLPKLSQGVGPPGLSFGNISHYLRTIACLSNSKVVSPAPVCVAPCLNVTETWPMSSDALHRLMRNDCAMIRWMCRASISNGPPTLEFLIIAALRLIFLTQNGQISSLSLITKFLLMTLWFLLWHDFSSDAKSNQILSFPNRKIMWAPMSLMMSVERCNYYGIAIIRNSRVLEPKLTYLK